MAESPTGTITFLFTDIAGSTRMWEQHPDVMRPSLARHVALLHAAIDAHSGHVFKTVGDAFCAAFQTAPDALAAALAAQRALAAEPWPDETPIRVRIGLHTGVADAEGGDYFGQTLNRVARLMSAGHGGQTLLSAAAWELVRDDLPVGVTLRDLGERRLKDLRRPERVFQVLSPDLPADFPPLATLDARPNNLPVKLTSFVGRVRETAEVKRLLGASHLVTLTGVGGTGKTRLALQVAADLIDDFDHGVWFVDLAPLTDLDLVASTVRAVLGVKEVPGRTVEEGLVDSLKAKRLLVILDNCEHVVAACAELARRVLGLAEGVRILATSREALAAAGEAILSVPPLATPPPPGAGDRWDDAVTALEQFAAVRLFIDRAQAVRADFAVTNANAPAVAGICHRLDGIPLAIELAAARVKMLTAGEIHGRLADRFKLLTGGSRTMPSRQQTLLAAIDWSHDLLEPAEQVLFMRLSVFRGGWTMRAAEDVCAADDIDGLTVLDLMARLVDKSLVVADDAGGETRFRFLETVRAYAQDKLDASGTVEAIRDGHLIWILDVCQRAEPELLSADAPNWVVRLEPESDNVRAAVAWSVGSADPERSERGVLLVLSAWPWLANHSGSRAMVPWLDAALEARITGGQPQLLARCSHACAQVHNMNADLSQARVLYEQAISMFTQLGMAVELARALHDLAGNLMGSGTEPVEGMRLLQQSLVLKRQVAAPWDLAISVNVYGEAARSQGDLDTAIAAYEEAIALTQADAGGANARMWPLHNLGFVALRSGDVIRSVMCLTQALQIAGAHRFRYGIASCMAGLAASATAGADHVRAAQLFGAADALLAEIGATGLDPLDQADREHFQAITRARSAPGTWEGAYGAGRAMPPEQAVAYALGEANSTHD